MNLGRGADAALGQAHCGPLARIYSTVEADGGGLNAADAGRDHEYQEEDRQPATTEQDAPIAHTLISASPIRLSRSRSVGACPELGPALLPLYSLRSMANRVTAIDIDLIVIFIFHK